MLNQCSCRPYLDYLGRNHNEVTIACVNIPTVSWQRLPSCWQFLERRGCGRFETGHRFNYRWLQSEWTSECFHYHRFAKTGTFDTMMMHNYSTIVRWCLTYCYRITFTQARDVYFMESGDKIRYFFEEGALNDKCELVVDKHRSLNKIGHVIRIILLNQAKL